MCIRGEGFQFGLRKARVVHFQLDGQAETASKFDLPIKLGILASSDRATGDNSNRSVSVRDLRIDEGKAYISTIPERGGARPH